MDTKVCSKCKLVKKVSEFHKQKDKQDGYRSHCKSCRIQTFKDNEEQLIKRRKELRQQNKDKINKRVREHYAKNIDIIRQKSKEYYQKNKERLLIRDRLRSKKEHIKKRTCERLQERKQKDPAYKALCNLKRKIVSVIRGNPKADTSKKLLGCTKEEFIKHIESKFVEGMTWENYGYYGWHIDHIRPCASFDMSDPEQQRQCFHYTNLQPLWMKDNLFKKDKYEF
jgi:hypothetical protein